MFRSVTRSSSYALGISRGPLPLRMWRAKWLYLALLVPVLLIYIDIPMTRRQITLAMILTMLFMTQRFDLFLVMTDGGPGYSTMVPALQLFQSAFNFLEFGYASAIGVVLFVGMLALTVINLRVSSGASD